MLILALNRERHIKAFTKLESFGSTDAYRSKQGR